jgi:hypothetical protein
MDYFEPATTAAAMSVDNVEQLVTVDETTGADLDTLFNNLSLTDTQPQVPPLYLQPLAMTDWDYATAALLSTRSESVPSNAADNAMSFNYVEQLGKVPTGALNAQLGNLGLSDERLLEFAPHDVLPVSRLVINTLKVILTPVV